MIAFGLHAYTFNSQPNDNVFMILYVYHTITSCTCIQKHNMQEIKEIDIEMPTSITVWSLMGYETPKYYSNITSYFKNGYAYIMTVAYNKY